MALRRRGFLRGHAFSECPLKPASFGSFLAGQEKNIPPHLLIIEKYYFKEYVKKIGDKLPLSYIHPAASSIFSIKIPYPMVGSFTSTWVTAPTIFPFWQIGEPLTSVSI